MTQFYVPQENINKDTIRITGDEIHHLTGVLRKKIGEEINVFDGKGTIYRVRIEKIHRDFIETKIISQIFSPETKFKLHLFPAILKNPRMDYLIEKVVELGVDEITPLITENTVVELNPQTAKSKINRWQKIVLSAAKQCGGAKLPSINSPLAFSRALEKLNPATLFEGAGKSTRLISSDVERSGQRGGINLIFWEKEKKNNLREYFSALRSPLSTNHYPLSTINLFVGPEGGFSEPEINQTEKYSFIQVGLGGRILRSETAAIVATTLVLYECSRLN